MAYITGTTKNGQEWIPQFIKAIDKELLYRMRSLLQGVRHGCADVRRGGFGRQRKGLHDGRQCRQLYWLPGVWAHLPEKVLFF